MKNTSIKSTIMSVMLSIILISTVITGITSIYGIKLISKLANSKYEKAVEDGYKTQVKDEVDSIITILQSEYEKSQSGVLTEEEAKKEAAEIIRDMRYGDNQKGYFWIDDTDYNLVMHPVLAKQQGTNRYDLEDKNGVKIVQKIIKTATDSENGGYNKFYFTKEDGKTVAPKIAYSKLFKPWNWVVSTGNYTDGLEHQIYLNEKQIAKKGQIMFGLIVCVGVVMAIIAMFSTKLFGDEMSKSLKDIQGLADRIAGGNLTLDIEIEKHNEIGSAAESLNSAQHQMAELVSDIGNTSNTVQIAVEDFKKNFDSINQSIHNVSLAVEEITKNINSQAVSTSSASENIEQIGNDIKNTSFQVKTLHKNSQIMKQCSEKSMKTLNKLVDVNTKTKEDIDSMYSQTEHTNDSVSKISKAATLISEIADQTNLLSLNASIEAARAGEGGRGFSVVAEEISQLASQSAETAKEINDIIIELSNNSKKSVEIMQRMNKVSKTQVSALNNTHEMFEELKEASNECIASIGMISNKIENIDGQRQAITGNITSLNKLASDNAAFTEETSAMAIDMKNIVEKSSDVVKTLAKDMERLAGNVEKFKI